MKKIIEQYSSLMFKVIIVLVMILLLFAGYKAVKNNSNKKVDGYINGASQSVGAQIVMPIK